MSLKEHEEDTSGCNGGKWTQNGQFGTMNEPIRGGRALKMQGGSQGNKRQTVSQSAGGFWCVWGVSLVFVEASFLRLVPSTKGMIKALHIP